MKHNHFAHSAMAMVHYVIEKKTHIPYKSFDVFLVLKHLSIYLSILSLSEQLTRISKCLLTCTVNLFHFRKYLTQRDSYGYPWAATISQGNIPTRFIMHYVLRTYRIVRHRRSFVEDDFPSSKNEASNWCNGLELLALYHIF